MNARTIIFSVSTGLIVIALFVLFAQVQGNPAVEVPERALEEARQRHERANAARSRPDPGETQSFESPPPRRPGPRARAGNRDEPSAQPEDLPEERRRPRFDVDRERGNQPFSVTSSMQQGRALKDRMDETNKLYDSRDYEGAIASAQEILKDMPRNVRMLRVVVSSACITGDEGMAREHYAMLPARDQEQMSVRCKRYGVAFDPPSAGAQ
jgi:hypothetical protein